MSGCPVDGCTLKQEIDAVRQEYKDTREDYQKTHDGYHEVKTALAVATSELKRANENDSEIFKRMNTSDEKLATKVDAPYVGRMIGATLAILFLGGGAVWALAVFVLDK